MSGYKDLIENLKQEVTTQTSVAAIEKQANEYNNVSVNDLGFELTTSNIGSQVSDNIEKIAKEIDNTNSVDEIVKVAQEIGNSDIANLVKIADAIGDRIADVVITKIKTQV